MLAIKWARDQKKPFLGICFGFQLAVVEWARNVCGLEGATSAEFDPAAREPVIVFMPEISKTHMGGTMRLGLRPTVFEEEAAGWSKVRKLYGGAGKIWERHRHRYEVNPALIERLTASGMRFVGKDERGERMQVLELPGQSLFQLACPSWLVLILIFMRRPPLLRRLPSAPRVLHAPAEPVTAFPRVHSGRGRHVGNQRAARGPAALIQAAAPRGLDGRRGVAPQ